MASPSSPQKQHDAMPTSTEPSSSSSSETEPPSYELLDHPQPTDLPSPTPDSTSRTTKPPSHSPNPTNSLIFILIFTTALALVLSLNIHGMLSSSPEYTERGSFVFSCIAEAFLSIGLLYAIGIFCLSVTAKRQANLNASVPATASTTTTMGMDAHLEEGGTALPAQTQDPARVMRCGPSILFAFFAVVIHIIASACSGVQPSRVFTFAFVVFWIAFAIDFMVLGIGRFMLRLLDGGVARIVEGKKGGHRYVRVPT